MFALLPSWGLGERCRDDGWVRASAPENPERAERAAWIAGFLQHDLSGMA